MKPSEPEMDRRQDGTPAAIALVAWVAAMALTGVAGAQAVSVILRSIYGISVPALEDLAIYLSAVAILIGIPLALARGAHVRIQFVQQYSSETEAWRTLLGHLCLTLPFALVLAVLAWPYALRSWLTGEGASDPDGLGGVYLIKFLIVISAGLLALAALVQAAFAARLLARHRARG